MVPLISVKSHTARNGVRSYVKPSVCNFWSATRFYPWPSIVSLVRQRSAEYCEIKSSLMFADDTKLFKEIRTVNDAKQLQNDISNLQSWSTTSGLSFNGTKCKAQTVTRKLKPITTSYAMKDCQLTSTKNERDLGVWISTDLRWNKQVNQQCARANKELSYIRRNTRTIHNTTTNLVPRAFAMNAPTSQRVPWLELVTCTPRFWGYSNYHLP